MNLKNNKALKVSNLGKKFFFNRSRTKNVFQNLCFEVKKGESLALIGINGCGKTTLLKILSQTLKPSEGVVEIHGKIVSLIDAEGNFEGNLTGQQNVSLFLEMHGMHKKQIDSCLDRTREFSGLENTFYDPVKTYSKGMISRLLLAAAFEVKADIYLIDEVFFAGDAEFIGKMEEKRKELSSEGISFIIATHNIKEVVQFSDLCLWLQNDSSFCFGPTSEIVNFYLEYVNQQNLNIKKNQFELVLTERTEESVFKPNLLELSTVEVIIRDNESSYKNGFEVQLNVDGQLNKYKTFPAIIVHSSKLNALIVSTAANTINPNQLIDGDNMFQFEFPSEHLIPGNYNIEIIFSKLVDENSPHLQEVYRVPQYFLLSVKEDLKVVYGSDERSLPINVKGNWKTK
jgi:ABC-type polysaccharide/polyol phosphate transport system ATPase subunit